MQTAKDLFIHELTDMLDAEQKLIEALGELSEDDPRPELQKAFSAHREQTEGQAERIQQIFQELGEEPEESECKGMKGLIEEREAFKEEDPAEDILAAFDVGAAIKVESYEINAYTSLIDLATELGFNKAVKLLNQNLKEEQQTLKKMQVFKTKVKPENLGIEEEEQGEEQQSSRQRRSPKRAASSKSQRSRSRRAA
jgi:ferritin-like metal-binding protein YciE